MNTEPKCPKCGSQNSSKAANPRHYAPGNVMVRFKVCGECEHRYRTVESAVEDEGGALVVSTLGGAWWLWDDTRTKRLASIRNRERRRSTTKRSG